MEARKVKITKSQLKQIIKEELENVVEVLSADELPPSTPTAGETEYDRIIQSIKEILEVSTDDKFDLAGELRAIADYAVRTSSLEEGMYNYDCPPGQSFYKYPDRPGGHCKKDPDSPGTQTKRQPMSGAQLSQAYRDRRGYEE